MVSSRFISVAPPDSSASSPSPSASPSVPPLDSSASNANNEDKKREILIDNWNRVDPYYFLKTYATIGNVLYSRLALERAIWDVTITDSSYQPIMGQFFEFHKEKPEGRTELIKHKISKNTVVQDVQVDDEPLRIEAVVKYIDKIIKEWFVPRVAYFKEICVRRSKFIEEMEHANAKIMSGKDVSQEQEVDDIPHLNLNASPTTRPSNAPKGASSSALRRTEVENSKSNVSKSTPASPASKALK
jgi:hypothetical protein